MRNWLGNFVLAFIRGFIGGVVVMAAAVVVLMVWNWAF